MSLIKPRAVREGAVLGVVSPSSSAREERVAAGIKALHSLGYKTKVFPHALSRGPLYYAGNAQERADDLHAAFADPEVDAVICTRGGWGAAELLPLLDADLVRRNAKAFLGYSDQTTLHLWLRQEVGLISFQAPMVAADFGKSDGRVYEDPAMLPVDLASWRSALTSTEPWGVGEAEGLRVLRPGVVEGESSGGCLSIYAQSLGTPWAARPSGGILFLEDIAVKPYQWDRMLVHLRHAGCLRDVSGIVFGDMGQCCQLSDYPAMEASLLHALSDFEGPIGIGLRSGHVSHGNVTIPLGVKAGLCLREGQAASLTFHESAVETR